MGILERAIASTPFAVIDIETTGLAPRGDRIVELAIVVVKRGEEPRLVLDTLLHPERPIACTEIHGITDAEVAGAPTFRDLFDTIVAALSNRVIVSHNAGFDVAFLCAELERCGYPAEPPHLCTMMLPRAIDPAAPGRLSLRHACMRHEIEIEEQHRASADAMASARLLTRQLESLRKKKLRTFGELRAQTAKDYAFLESFDGDPIPPPPRLLTSDRLRPRGKTGSPLRKAGVAQYLDELLRVAADLRLDESEHARLLDVRRELTLSDGEIRAVHAKLYWGMLSRFVEDAIIDRAEVVHLRSLHELLSQLGWAPGEPAPTDVHR